VGLALAFISTRVDGLVMQKIAMLVAAAASLGTAATFTPELRPSGQAVADLGYSLLAGVVLGAGVWPYGASPIPPELQSSLLLRYPECDTLGRCGTAGPAAATLADGRSGAVDAE
jgi:hypothetical protein